MERNKSTEEDVANQILRLLRRISELEAAEMERCRAGASVCQVAAGGRSGGYSGGTEFATVVMRAPRTGVLGLN